MNYVIIVNAVLEFYIIFVILITVFKIYQSDKKTRAFILPAFFFLVFGLFLSVLSITALSFFSYLLSVLSLVVFLIVYSNEFKKNIEFHFKSRFSETELLVSSIQTKQTILEAVLELSQKRIGALITIERLNTLSLFTEKAISLDSIITTELLINIFMPTTPLHDGAVIIRGDRIVCAGAYFALSDSILLDKTTGSRHRAALGISENSDSFTIVVSEETGKISLAINKILIPINSKENLSEYLTTLYS